jgi:hypothetical protein
MSYKKSKNIPKKNSIQSESISTGKKSENLIPNTKEKGLITLNQTIIRKKALGECQKTLKKIDKVKQEIDQFEKKDKPAYDRWIQENFGELIQKIKSWSLEIQEKRALIDEVQEEAFIQNITFIEAFQIVKYRREHPEEFIKEENKKSGEENFWENTVEDEEDIFREDLNDFFKRFNEKYNMNSEEFESFKKGLNGEANSKKPQDRDARLKERYRLIVQRLHPDKNKNASQMERELWHDAQEAYKKKDLEKLDFIIALFNIRFGSIGMESTIFDLKTANSKLEKTLKQFGQMIRRAKSEPAWLFLSLKPAKLSSLKNEAAKEFKDYERITSIELREINSILSKWEKASLEAANNTYSKRRTEKLRHEDDFMNFYMNF